MHAYAISFVTCVFFGFDILMPFEFREWKASRKLGQIEFLPHAEGKIGAARLKSLDIYGNWTWTSPCLSDMKIKVGTMILFQVPK